MAVNQTETVVAFALALQNKRLIGDFQLEMLTGQTVAVNTLIGLECLLTLTEFESNLRLQKRLCFGEGDLLAASWKQRPFLLKGKVEALNGTWSVPCVAIACEKSMLSRCGICNCNWLGAMTQAPILVIADDWI